MPASLPRRVLAPLLGLSLVLLPRAAAAVDAVEYRLPVDAEVVAGFESPADHYAAGHRGIDLGVPPGTSVAAAATGVVSHAGEVAGVTWVSVRHADGVVTSYGPMALLRVTVGDTVVAGDVLGVVAASTHGNGVGRGLHWGARHDGSYLDPRALLGPVQVPSLVGPGGWSGTHPVVEPFEPWEGAKGDGWFLHDSPKAEGPSFGVPPNPNHLFVVGGLNSATESPVIDPRHLGYGEGDATRYSYAGLDDRGEPRPYGAPDTWEGLDAAARQLAAQLRRQQREQPFRAVDLLGHSQGGVVIAHYLANYHDPFDPELPPIDNVVTVAAPHRGADLANLGRTVRDDLALGAGAGVGAFLGDPHGRRWKGAAGPPLDELSVGSPFLRDLSHRFEAAVEADTAGPFATGTRVLTLGAAGDWLVPTHRAQAPGNSADHDAVLEPRVLPGGHEGVLETQAMHEVTYRFLQGDEPVESPGRFATAASWVSGTTWRMLAEGYETGGLYKAGRTVLDAELPMVPLGEAVSDPWGIGSRRAPHWWPDPLAHVGE